MMTPMLSLSHLMNYLLVCIFVVFITILLVASTAVITVGADNNVALRTLLEESSADNFVLNPTP